MIAQVNVVTRLQDHIPTQKKQVNIWCYLLMQHFIQRNASEGFKTQLLREDFSLFNNAPLKRRLDSEFVDAILKELERNKKIEFKDRNRDAFFIFKVSPDMIAQALDRWAVKNGRQGRMETLTYLSTSEGTDGEVFHNLPEDLILKGGRILEGKGKAGIIDVGGSYVIKFKG